MFTHKKIFFGQENFFCLEPISCAWELKGQRKIVCPRKIVLCVNQALAVQTFNIHMNLSDTIDIKTEIKYMLHNNSVDQGTH